MPINLAIGLGLRISEVLGLSWSDIDFVENTITIDKITARESGKVILKEPKQSLLEGLSPRREKLWLCLKIIKESICKINFKVK